MRAAAVDDLFLFFSISLNINITRLIVSIFFSVLIFHFGILFLSGFIYIFGLTPSLDSAGFAQAYGIVLLSFISSSISSQNS